MRVFVFTILAALLGACSPARVAERPPSVIITVDAGDWDRRETPVVLDLPERFPASARLVDPRGNDIPLQVTADRRAAFILPQLAAGERMRLELVAEERGETRSSIRAELQGSALDFSINGQPMFSYQTTPGELPRPDIDPVFRRGGYIHPVRTPSGVRVTEDYPRQHVHHHGIWFAWTNTRFEKRAPDFWNMGQRKGTVEFIGMETNWSGPVHAGFKSEHQFVDLLGPEPKAVLLEKWQVTAYNVGAEKPAAYHLFDLISVQRCATDEPLVLPKYHYGGLGFRGHEQWETAGLPRVLTSEGETDRVKANESRARWCRITGEVDGQTAGIAILSHPENFRAPQPMRMHPKEPFFCYAPSQLGDWSIEPGEEYISRYRFVVFDGELSAAELDRLWADYAHPVSVKIEE